MLALVRPFEEMKGVTVNMEHYGGELDAVRNQVEAANVKWDVVDFEYSDLIKLCDEGYPRADRPRDDSRRRRRRAGV